MVCHETYKDNQELALPEEVEKFDSKKAVKKLIVAKLLLVLLSQC